MFYLLFSCSFEKCVRDLRPKSSDWLKLTDDSDEICQKLVSEAREIGLDAFLAPSARRLKGTNVPVLTRELVCNPLELTQFAFTYDPFSECVTCHQV